MTALYQFKGRASLRLYGVHGEILLTGPPESPLCNIKYTYCCSSMFGWHRSAHNNILSFELDNCTQDISHISYTYPKSKTYNIAPKIHNKTQSQIYFKLKCFPSRSNHLFFYVFSLQGWRYFCQQIP